MREREKERESEREREREKEGERERYSTDYRSSSFIIKSNKMSWNQIIASQITLVNPF